MNCIHNICNNCEINTADHRCTSCTTDQLFCNNCWDIHTQVKAFKHHVCVDISEEHTTPLCTNCDTRVASMQCNQCETSESYFCSTCWNVHIQVKACRSHVGKPLPCQTNEQMETSRNSSKNSRSIGAELSRKSADIVFKAETNFLDTLYSYFEMFAAQCGITSLDNTIVHSNWIVESVCEITGSRDLDIKTIIFGLSFALIAHVGIKLIFGKNSIYIIVAVGILAVRWLKRRQHVLNAEIDSIQHDNTDISDEIKSLHAQSLPQDFNTLQNQFWYDSQDTMNSRDSEGGGIRTPVFRPRGPLYRRKRPKSKPTES